MVNGTELVQFLSINLVSCRIGQQEIYSYAIQEKRYGIILRIMLARHDGQWQNSQNFIHDFVPDSLRRWIKCR